MLKKQAARGSHIANDGGACCRCDRRYGAGFIEARLAVLTWMVGFNLVMTAGTLWRVFTH